MASDRRPEPEWDAGSGPPPGRGGPNPVPTGSGRHPGGGHLPMSSGTAASGRRRGRPAAARRAAGATGTLPRPGESADGTEPVPAGRRWPWRTLLAALGGGVLVLAFPATDLPALAVLGPAALALAVRRQRFRSGLWLGLVFGLAFFVPLLSWTGVYVGPFPWLALAVWEALHLALLGAATAGTSPPSPPGCGCGRCGRRRCGWPTRRCAGAWSSAASPGAGSGSPRPGARCCRWRPTAASRWSASPAPSTGAGSAPPSSRSAAPGAP